MNLGDKNKKPTWTVEEIHSTVKTLVEQFIREHGRPPYSREWDSFQYRPTRASIRKYLGTSFNAYLSQLGYAPENEPSVRYSHEELLNFLRKLYFKFKRVPTTEDFGPNRPPGYPHFSCYYRAFGSFNLAIQRVGLSTPKGFTADYLNAKVLDYIEEFGKPPCKNDLDGRKRSIKYPKSSAYIRVFGSLEKCITDLGFEPRAKSLPDIFWTEEKITQEVKDQVDNYIIHNRRPPRSGEWDRLLYTPSRAVIRKRLGLSFNDLLLMLNYVPNQKSPQSYTEESLLQSLREYYQEHGKTPTFQDLKTNDQYPDPMNYIRTFGSYEKALAKAGLISNKWLEAKFLMSEVHRYIEEHNRNPGSNEIRFHKGYPCEKGYRRIWGGVSQCLIAMGLTPPSCEIKNQYSRKVVASDGHLCDSGEEAFLDDWLSEHGVFHNRGGAYPLHKFNINGMKRSDFTIYDRSNNSVLVEYAGLIGKAKYKANIDQKIEMAKEHVIRLIVVCPWQLGQLDEIFKEFIN